MNILVTGANKGIGLEVCRQLARLEHRVILSARSAERGEGAVKTLAHEGLKTEFLLLDTSDEASIRRAARDGGESSSPRSDRCRPVFFSPATSPSRAAAAFRRRNSRSS